MVIIGSLFAVASAAIITSLAVILGDITNTFDPFSSSDSVMTAMRTLMRNILIIGGAGAVAGYFHYAFWQHVAENITFDLRSRFLHKLLEQEIAFFEK